ncbi:hypothetical protein PaG_04345 [Moesziomyces aphidis]|uniref:Fe2OG dioxygenase domain-containing protein n=1 Tax=Moesziomyces aphidis TaxID=84754 RepID=W3VIJ5_MOEAP|nr:hypothetical protein PaG_04345 [Moesziomyces aphidis]
MDVDDDCDSLFGSGGSDCGDAEAGQCGTADEQSHVASRQAPPIPGLFFFPTLLSREVHDRILAQVSERGYFSLDADEYERLPGGTKSTGLSNGKDGYDRSPRNQAMLFARSLPSEASDQADADNKTSTGYDGATDDQDADAQACSGLPSWAVELIQHLRQMLLSLSDYELPLETKQLVFPPGGLLSRQLILNLYRGGEGLASHVDLVNRFADGILLCSFGPSGCGTVMEFTHASGKVHPLFLPSGSVLLLSREARYEWKHGIPARSIDLVRSSDDPGHVEAIARSIRLSITIRSMLPGADIVGE